MIAGLINSERKKVMRNALIEFIQYGVRYVFPEVPGAIITGIETAHSHPFYKKHFASNMPYVWPAVDGNARGQAIKPYIKVL